MKPALFNFSVLVSLVSCFSPSPLEDPSLSPVTGEDPLSVRFAPLAVTLNAGDLLHPANLSRSHLKLTLTRRSVSAWIIIILLAGDIELNPGPNWKYPCGVCSGPVRSNQKGIFCDVCNTWLHTRCIGLSDRDYSNLLSSPDTWACRRCLSETLPFQDTSSLPSPTTSPSRSLTDCVRPSQISTSNSSLNILYTNCRSLCPKMDELRCLTSQHLPNIICLCETWLDDSIFVHDSTPFKVLSIHPQIELLILELTLNSRKLSCALFYRPPSSDSSVLHQLDDALDVLPPIKTRSFLILGDFNIDISHNMTNSTLSSIQAKHDLSQVVSLPTRSTKSTSSTIDHIYLSNCLM